MSSYATLAAWQCDIQPDRLAFLLAIAENTQENPEDPTDSTFVWLSGNWEHAAALCNMPHTHAEYYLATFISAGAIVPFTENEQQRFGCPRGAWVRFFALPQKGTRR